MPTVYSYQNFMQDRKGNALAGATVTVREAGSSNNATLYQDNGTDQLDNPLTTDSRGFFKFAAIIGRYDLVIEKAGFEGITLTVPIHGTESAGYVGFATKADMDQDLDHPDGAIAYVTNDTTADNNWTYRKSGASGSGSWVKASTDRVAEVEARTDDLESVSVMVAGKNVLGDTYTSGYVTASGAVFAHASYHYQEMIPCKANQQYNVSRDSESLRAASYIRFGCFFDDSGEVIPVTSTDYENVAVFTTPATAAFMTLTFPTAHILLQVEEGATISEYAPGYTLRKTERGQKAAAEIIDGGLIVNETDDDGSVKSKAWIEGQLATKADDIYVNIAVNGNLAGGDSSNVYDSAFQATVETTTDSFWTDRGINNVVRTLAAGDVGFDFPADDSLRGLYFYTELLVHSPSGSDWYDTIMLHIESWQGANLIAAIGVEKSFEQIDTNHRRYFTTGQFADEPMEKVRLRGRDTEHA